MSETVQTTIEAFTNEVAADVENSEVVEAIETLGREADDEDHLTLLVENPEPTAFVGVSEDAAKRAYNRLADALGMRGNFSKFDEEHDCPNCGETFDTLRARCGHQRACDGEDDGEDSADDSGVESAESSAEPELVTDGGTSWGFAERHAAEVDATGELRADGGDRQNDGAAGESEHMDDSSDESTGSECAWCGATGDADDDIETGIADEIGTTLCTVCLADVDEPDRFEHNWTAWAERQIDADSPPVEQIEQRAEDLADVTELSEREALVWAFKERTELTHEEIGDEIGVEKSSVDNFARRGQGKNPIESALSRARRTLEVLDPDTTRYKYDVIDAIKEREQRRSGHEQGAEVGDVIETVLDETTADVGAVGSILRAMYFDGEIYQPNATSIATTDADDDSGGEGSA